MHRFDEGVHHHAARVGHAACVAALLGCATGSPAAFAESGYDAQKTAASASTRHPHRLPNFLQKLRHTTTAAKPKLAKPEPQPLHYLNPEWSEQ